MRPQRPIAEARAKKMMLGQIDARVGKAERATLVREVQQRVDAIRSLPPTDDENKKRERVRSRKAITSILHPIS